MADSGKMGEKLTNLNIDISVEILKTLTESSKTRGEIARKLSEKGYKRTTVYHYIARLEELKLIEYFEKDKKIYYKITDRGKKFLEAFL